MKTRVNMIANYGGQAWIALMGFVFAPIYIHLLGIEAYGLIGFFSMLQVWLTVLDLGILPTSVREMARYTSGAETIERTRDLLRSFEIICGGIGISAAVILWLAAGPISAHWLNAQALPPETVRDAVALIGVVLGSRLMEGLYRSCLIGLQRQVWLNVAGSLLATLRSVGAVALLLWVRNSVELFFLWQAMVSLLTLAIFSFAIHRALPQASRPTRFSRSALASVGRFAAEMLGINLLSVLLTQVDKLLLSNLLPLADYGYYMLASTVTGVLFLFTGPITQAIYPAMVEQVAAGDRAGFSRNFHRAAQLVSAILSPLAIALMLFARPLLFVWSGDGVLADSAAPILALLAIGTLANLFMQVPYYMQVAHGWTSFALKVNVVAVLVLVPALMGLTPRWGVNAAAGTWAVLNFSYLLIAPIVFRRLMPGEAGRWYLQDLAKPMLAAGSVLVAAWLVPIHFGTDRLLQAGFLVVAGGLAMAASLSTVDGVWRMGRGLLLRRA